MADKYIKRKTLQNFKVIRNNFIKRSGKNILDFSSKTLNEGKK